MIWLALVGALLAQAPSPKLPATAADVATWGAAIVRRAAALIPTPARWDRASTGDCPAHATSVSLICALQQASDEAGANQPTISDCRFHPTSDGWEGSCGTLFGEASVFSVKRVASVITGVWRKDARSGPARCPTPHHR
jgi:hypothetical protein